MTRAEVIGEQYALPTLQAIYITQKLSQMIAEEILAHAEFLELEGDIYDIVGGLRKAASIAANFNQEPI